MEMDLWFQRHEDYLEDTWEARYGNKTVARKRVQLFYLNIVFFKFFIWFIPLLISYYLTWGRSFSVHHTALLWWPGWGVQSALQSTSITPASQVRCSNGVKSNGNKCWALPGIEPKALCTLTTVLASPGEQDIFLGGGEEGCNTLKKSRKMPIFFLFHSKSGAS